MAGNYPDVPAPRMAYDLDGTVGFMINPSNVVITLSDANLRAMNDEDGDAYTIPGHNGSNTYYVGLIFPQPRDISGLFVSAEISSGNLTMNRQVSSDTTNGLDGTWSAGTSVVFSSTVSPGYRSSITSLSLSNVKGIRFSLTGNGGSGVTKSIYALHLYGALASGETPDRLRMWHPTLDEPLDENNPTHGAYFDWGDIQRNTTSDKTFRIKNNSDTLTANGVIISQETVSDTTPAINSQFTFSDGGVFAPSINIGDLPPGAISSVITKRYTRPSNATLSLWASRTIAEPTSWS